MRFMLEIKRNIFTRKESSKLFTEDEIKDYNFNSFEEIDNSSIRDYLKNLDFIKIGKTKGKLEDNIEIFVTGIEINDSVLKEEGIEFNKAIEKLDEFDKLVRLIY